MQTRGGTKRNTKMLLQNIVSLQMTGQLCAAAHINGIKGKL